ncbi:MAG: spore coat protein CotJB, partial [Oscillospiraceae bacterium]
NLFLDTHKTCKEAMEYFKKHKEHSNKYRAEYTEKYGPLTVRDDSDSEVFEWVNSNWPWEFDGEVL